MTRKRKTVAQLTTAERLGRALEYSKRAALLLDGLDMADPITKGFAGGIRDRLAVLEQMQTRMSKEQQEVRELLATVRVNLEEPVAVIGSNLRKALGL